ncbi:hypothetical protein AURDEDRAFT_172661 [Auricularia subglabra TFB-10046 SS5]|nr:hypothetical protein AURDEDRAFT_172661 [Auricularia subglabra TFB-10046 SS5]
MVVLVVGFRRWQQPQKLVAAPLVVGVVAAIKSTCPCPLPSIDDALLRAQFRSFTRPHGHGLRQILRCWRHLQDAQLSWEAIDAIYLWIPTLDFASTRGVVRAAASDQRPTRRSPFHRALTVLHSPPPAMSSRRFSRRAGLAARSRSPPLARTTRSTLRALPDNVADLAGRPIMCPIPFCNTFVPPSFAANGTIEYRCYVGRHGRIAQVVNGRVELTVRTVISPRRRVLPRRPKHCLEEDGSCGGYKHDYARALEDLSERQRQASIEVHPGTPLFFPSPSSSPSPPPPSSPVPGIDFDPSVAYVQLVFLDRDLTVEDVCVVQHDLVDLTQQSLRIRDNLQVHQIRPASLEFLGPDGEWYCTAGRAVPVRYGQLYLRARTVGNARNFPLAHYIDMAPRVDRFYRLVGRNVSPDDAFESVFDCEPSKADHESLKLCHEVLQKSPRHLRNRFEAAGRTPQGTWSEFVHTCFGLQGERPSTPQSDEESSPTFARSRPAWRGPPSSEAGSSRTFNQNASPPPIIIDSDSE